MVSALRKRATASLALLSLVALFFGDFTRGVHLLTARHVLCAAHGDLVEAEGGETTRTRTEGEGAEAIPGESALDHHEHCSVAATPTRAFVTEVATAVLVAVAAPASTVASSLPDSPECGRDAISFAPKQGPPKGA